jgi:uroporphyrinogen decarboxylase
MRQAGRALPEYRALRGSGSILEAAGDPELVAELTVQPVRRYGVDAAILFSDIVVPVAALGFGVTVAPGTGPVVAEPFRDRRDLDRLPPYDPEVHTPFLGAAVRATVEALRPFEVPLIGFAGAPFTVASYLVEGGPTRVFARTKALMHGDPALWAALMDRLADVAAASLLAQVRAGAQAVQLFDSWVGNLSPDEYARFVAPASAKVLAALAPTGVPRIHFGVGTAELLPQMAAAGADVVGVDWRTPLDRARRRLGPAVALQGNLDPALCLAPWPVVAAEAREVLRRGGGQGHVFNLGHGVLPDTDPQVLERLVALVHDTPLPEPLAPAPPGTVGEGDEDPTRTSRSRATTPHLDADGPIGVLLLAHGTPGRLEDVEPFYTEIRRGSPPPPALLQELVDRYRAIGGTSPLVAISEAQRAGVARALAGRLGRCPPVALGQKFAEPRIEAAVDRLVAAGCRRVVGVVLAPHSSVVSVGEYRRRALAAAADRLELTVVDRWHLHPGLVALLAQRVRRSLEDLRLAPGERAFVLCTAHSVPERVVAGGDDYPAQVRATAEAVLGAAGVAEGGVCFQSAGRTAEAWVGPDLLQEIDRLAAEGYQAVLVCPVGFVSDHLEVLYDLDVEAAARAAAAGIRFARTPSLNDDPGFCAVVADVALTALAAEGEPAGAS